MSQATIKANKRHKTRQQLFGRQVDVKRQTSCQNDINLSMTKRIESNDKSLSGWGESNPHH